MESDEQHEADEQHDSQPISEIHRAVGMRIRDARKAKELDQLALALLVGYKSASAITQIEKGTMNPTLTKLNAIAVALDKDLIELLPPGRYDVRFGPGHFDATFRAASQLPVFVRKECADLFRTFAEDIDALPRPGSR